VREGGEGGWGSYIVLKIDPCSRSEEEGDSLRVTTLTSEHEGRPLVFGSLRIDSGATLQEELHDLQMTREGSQGECSAIILSI
jgi:hypothetical protein